MRTYKEIVKEIENHKEEMFGVFSTDLIEYLDWKNIVPYLKPECVTKELEKKHNPKSRDREAIIKEMSDYMSFAIEKAENHRGLSASRSIEHYKAWVWLLGDEDYRGIDWDDYTNYGVPILKQICEVYKITFLARLSLQNMAKGRKCRPECWEGCS